MNYSEKVVVIWERNDGSTEVLRNTTTSVLNVLCVALNARGRRVLICDARTKDFLVSDGVESVEKRRTHFKVHHKPYRSIPNGRRYWRHMQRKMCHAWGAPAQITRLPKGLMDLIGSRP